MWFSVAVTVPASTTAAAFKETRIPVSRGIITHVSYRPRPGHTALCHAKVFYRERQIWPVSRDEDLHGDTYPIEWPDYEEILLEPFELVIRSWNEDDTYSHTFDLSFNILPERVVAPPNWGKVMADVLTLISPRRIFGGGA